MKIHRVFGFLAVLLCHSAFADLIHIPYVTVGGEWWSGLAVTNLSDQELLVAIYATTEDGVEKSGEFFVVKPHGMHVDLLQKYFAGGLPASRVHVRLGSLLGNPFKATLYVGNNSGFSFQHYDSTPN